MPDIIASKRETILTFFDASRQHEFLIPEYQRPYEWQTEEISDLFYDLKNFSDDENQRKNEDPNYNPDTYFLGTIIYFTNKDGKREIVDGQQRIISIFLLLRAIYEELSNNLLFQNFQKRRDDIERIIWKTDDIEGKIISPDKILIDTEAISDNSKSTFNSIIEKGKTDPEKKDSYSTNYRLIKDLIDKELLSKDGSVFKNFIVKLLDYTFVLPIESNNFDATLEIFERINDRGRQLTDTDIFKSKIYISMADDVRIDFIDRWKILEEKVQSIGESMKTLFMYQMFYERALNEDRSASKQISLRRYFLTQRSATKDPLKDPALISNLEKIFELLSVMKNRTIIVRQLWSHDFEITKMLDIIWKAPNDWWRYSAFVYYLAHMDKEDFPTEFKKFLQMTVASISILYALNLTRSEKKRFILNLNINVINSMHPEVDIPEITLDAFANDEHLTLKILRTFLHELAYSDAEQKSLLPIKWEVEYIFPRTFTENYPPVEEKTYMKQAINKFGNMTILDKRMKQVATPDYFQKKKFAYQKTSLIFTRKLSEYENFGVDDIADRTLSNFTNLINLWKNWINDYND